MVVIDTDVLIAFSKGNQEIIEKINKLEKSSVLSTTVLNAEEFLYGLYFAKKEEEIQNGRAMLQKLTIYNYSNSDVDNVIEVKVKLKKKGNPIGEYDEAIAGICIAKNEELFTLNKKHFKQIENLKLVKF